MNPASEWGAAEELLATVAELIDTSNRLTIAAYRGKNDPPVPEPLRIPRPYDTPAPTRRRTATPAEVRKFFGHAVRRTTRREGSD